MTTMVKDVLARAMPGHIQVIPVKENRLCPECGSTGFYLYRVPYGHPLFGQLQECQTCGEAAKRRLQALQEVSAWAQGMETMTFDSVQPLKDAADTEQMLAARDAARRFAHDPQGWFVLEGTWGNGKTMLLAAIANAQPPNRHWLYVRIRDVYPWLGCVPQPDPEAPYEDRLRLLQSVPLLLVDELGAEKNTEAIQDRRERLFDHRYLNHLPTAFACNVPVKDLYLNLPGGWGEGWMRSRLGDRRHSEVWTLPDRDFRLEE